MNKFRSPIFVLAGILLMTSISFAAENQVEITGTAFGVNTHLLHLDYATATRPTGTADDSRFDNASFYAGPTKQFYIPITDPDFSAVGPGSADFVASISTFTDDCDDITGCLLKGYIWSDVVGWIVLDGEGAINPAINDPNDGVPGDVYTPDMYPRIKSSGAVTGFAWNEKIGWIGLSSDLTNGTLQPAAAQTKDIWGIWLDIAADLVIEDMDTPADPSDDILIGRPFRGFAWSKKLGWIKFQIEKDPPIPPPDTFDFDFGVFTTWVPDDTPPNILSPSTVWFATGINTGYIAPPDPDATDPKTIVWNNFIADQESGIKSSEEGSEITIERTIDSDPECQTYVPLPENVILSTSADTEFKVGYLTIPLIGWLGQDGNIPPKGFCKYKLTAKILNGVNLPLYIGDTYVPPCDDYTTELACIDDTACNWTGVCEHKVEPNIAPDTDPNGVIIYVRSGNFDTTESTVSITGPKANGLNMDVAIADGRDFVEYEVALKDLVGNPIVDIDCTTLNEPLGTNPQYIADGCPEREVTINAQITNELVYDLTQNTTPAGITPAMYSDDSVFTTGTHLFDFDTQFEIFQPPTSLSLSHQVEIASFAPSYTYEQIANYQDPPTEKVFRINLFDYTIENESLPATGLMEVPPPPEGVFIDNPATVTPAWNESGQINDGDIGFVSTALTFIPPITTGPATLVSGGVTDVLTLSVPADVSFNINNISDRSIAQDGNGGLSIDNVFQYYSPSWSATLAVMESQRIKNTTAGYTDDGKLAWSDPFQTCPFCTRYEWYDGEHFTLDDQAAEDSVFHAFFQMFNPIVAPSEEQAKFLFDVEPPAYIESNLDGDGAYKIIGRESIPYEHSPNDPAGDLNDPTNWDEDGIIDRSDPADLELAAGAVAAASSISKNIQFTPEKYVPVTIDDIDLRLIHEIGYRFAGQPFFSVYAQSPVLSGISVKDIGVEAVGTVAGEEIVTDRKFDIVSTASTRKLQEQIRRNAAELIASIDAACAIPDPGNPLTEFPTTPGGCVVEDTVNQTMFAYYEGSAGEELVIGDGTDITAPDLPYTLIVKGGADVSIKSNIIYDPDPDKPRSSLGIIVIAENIGEGANIYISPGPTNMVGTVYTEGSLLSGAPGQLYYGGAPGIGNVQDLSNQLYWRGSIASRNTIAGAGLSPPKTPEGTVCLENGDTALSCAQRYDFDYLRRFTAVVKEAPETAGSFIASDGLFSGGGSCAAGSCTLGLLLPTTVVLAAGQIDVTESELAPFFIEKDPRTLSLPPPGFTLTGGFESIQEIR